MRWLAALVLGSSLVPRPLTERAQLADRVVVVQVLSSRVELRDGDVRKMFTHTEVVVGDVLKGPSGPGLDRLTITQLGGRYGLWESHVPGDATFVPGETALVLLRCSPTPSQCGLVGLAEGKVSLIGNDAFVFDLATNQHHKRPVADVLNEVRAAVATAKLGIGVSR
jgi:hypothetical protein